MRNVVRTPVLVLVESDGFISVHAGPHVDVHIQRVVAAPKRESEQMADDVTFEMVPKKYQHLYRTPARATEVARPLRPSSIYESLMIDGSIQQLNVAITANGIAPPTR